MKKMYLSRIRQFYSIALIGSIGILTQCSDPLDQRNHAELLSPSESIRVASGRLIFENRSVFNKAISQLNLMSNEDLDIWLGRFKFSSVLESIDTIHMDTLSYKRFPSSYQAVLNAN
jgi:hypothetical protein